MVHILAKLAEKNRVGIVDDHVLLREGLGSVLMRSGEYDIVFEGETSTDAISGVVRYEPDIVLLDLGIEGGGLEALRQIKADYPKIFCVILTSCDDPLKALAALSLGAEGYILKGIKSKDLLHALTGILAKQTFVSPDFAMRLITAVSEKSNNASQSASLSYREEQVISEVQNGLTNREVGQRLNLSEQTVKFYLSSAMQKLGVKNRVSAVREFQKQAGLR